MLEGAKPPHEGIVEKAEHAAESLWNGFESAESKILNEIGFSGPVRQESARIGEMVVGGAVTAAGVLAGATGVGLEFAPPAIYGGLALMADGEVGLLYDFHRDDEEINREISK